MLSKKKHKKKKHAFGEKPQKENFVSSQEWSINFRNRFQLIKNKIQKLTNLNFIGGFGIVLNLSNLLPKYKPAFDNQKTIKT